MAYVYFANVDITENTRNTFCENPAVNHVKCLLMPGEEISLSGPFQPAGLTTTDSAFDKYIVDATQVTGDRVPNSVLSNPVGNLGLTARIKLPDGKLYGFCNSNEKWDISPSETFSPQRLAQTAVLEIPLSTPSNVEVAIDSPVGGRVKVRFRSQTQRAMEIGQEAAATGTMTMSPDYHFLLHYIALQRRSQLGNNNFHDDCSIKGKDKPCPAPVDANDVDNGADCVPAPVWMIPSDSLRFEDRSKKGSDCPPLHFESP